MMRLIRRIIRKWTARKQELATVTRESVSHTGWQGSSITHIRARTPDGSLWYGKGAGRGMVIKIHRAKR